MNQSETPQRVKTPIRRWSDADVAGVRALLEQGLAVTTVARLTDRTPSAISVKLRKVIGGIRAARKVANEPVRTLRELARLFCVHPSIVTLWVRRGWLATQRNGAYTPHAPNGHYLVTDSQLRDFLTQRAAWVTYEPDRITDPAIAGQAATARATAGGRWLTTDAYGAAVGVSADTVRYRVSRRDSELPATQKVNGRWYLWLADGAARPAVRKPGRRPNLTKGAMHDHR